MLLSLNSLHHAYLVVASSLDAGGKAVQSALEQEGVRFAGSPDCLIYREETFGIDEARALAIAAERKAFTGRKIYLILPEKITLEAQNALLKTFEDPVPDTHFFLVVRNEDIIIPTLRSRCQVLLVKHSVFDKAFDNEVEKFLKFSLKERLVFVKKFVDKEENLSVFLDEMLLALRGGNSTASLESVYKLRLMSDDRAASPRLILEHLALVLP